MIKGRKLHVVYCVLRLLTVSRFANFVFRICELFCTIADIEPDTLSDKAVGKNGGLIFAIEMKTISRNPAKLGEMQQKRNLLRYNLYVTIKAS